MLLDIQAPGSLTTSVLFCSLRRVTPLKIQYGRLILGDPTSDYRNLLVADTSGIQWHSGLIGNHLVPPRDGPGVPDKGL